MISEKQIQKQKQEQSNFEGKDFFKEIPEEKSPTLKKISFICLSRKKNSILSSEVWQEKNSYPNQITHTSPLPPPSNSKWSVPNNPNETSHIPKELLHYFA